VVRDSEAPAQSKDPYTLILAASAAGSSHDALAQSIKEFPASLVMIDTQRYPSTAQCDSHPRIPSLRSGCQVPGARFPRPLREVGLSICLWEKRFVILSEAGGSR